MKSVTVTLEFDDSKLGENWVNKKLLETVLYTPNMISKSMLQVKEVIDSKIVLKECKKCGAYVTNLNEVGPRKPKSLICDACLEEFNNLKKDE